MHQALRYVVSVFLICALSLGGSGLLGGCNKREPQATVSKWTCPMHPEVVSAQEGLCPKCNMKLVPAKDESKPQAQQERQAAVSKWTCPMHPEVVSAQEGLCPKCNMKLVPAKDEPKRTTTAEPQLVKPAE